MFFSLITLSFLLYLELLCVIEMGNRNQALFVSIYNSPLCTTNPKLQPPALDSRAWWDGALPRPKALRQPRCSALDWRGPAPRWPSPAGWVIHRHPTMSPEAGLVPAQFHTLVPVSSPGIYQFILPFSQPGTRSWTRHP